MEEPTQSTLDSSPINPNAQGGGDNTNTGTVTTQANNGRPSFEECYLQAKEEVEGTGEPAQVAAEPKVEEPTETTKTAEATEEPREPVPADAETPSAQGDFNYQEAYENSKPVLEAVARAAQGDAEAQRVLAEHLGIHIGNQGQAAEAAPDANIPAEPTAVAELMESFSVDTFTNAVESILEKKLETFQSEYNTRYNMDMQPQREQAVLTAYDKFMEAHPEAKDAKVQRAMEPYIREGYTLENAFKIANYDNSLKTAEDKVRTAQTKKVEESKKVNDVLRQGGAGKTVPPKPTKFKDFGECYRYTKANMGG